MSVVCETCSDSHRMPLRGELVMCTKCPVPCMFCSGGPFRPYCASTPCMCACHSPKKVATEQEPELLRLFRDLIALGPRHDRQYSEPTDEDNRIWAAWDTAYNAIVERAKRLGLVE